MQGERGAVRLAAVGDIHCTRNAPWSHQRLFSQISESADILLLCGDLTGHGLPEEARVVAREVSASIRMPILGVLGNHEYESGKHEEIQRILADAGIQLLDGSAFEVMGIGFAGVKGFGGGFGERALQSWGEETIKTFVREAVEESLKLESALATLRTRKRVVLLHYSPIVGTVEGEPVEVYPFLGSSRLEEPIDRYHVTAVFHGHAHRGKPRGRTRGGVPVYNAALPLFGASGRPLVVEIAVADGSSPQGEVGPLEAEKESSTWKG
jgi:Icc-related predicted phosphoesterase